MALSSVLTPGVLGPATIQWATGGVYSPTSAYTSWSASASTLTRNIALSPDRKLNGMQIVEDTANSTHGAANTNVAFTQTAIPYVHTVWVRDLIGGRSFQIVHFDSAANKSISGDEVDVTGGIVLTQPTTDGTWTNLSMTAQRWSSGWVKVQLFFTGISDTSMWFVYRLVKPGIISYTGDGVSSIAVWGTDLRAV